MRTLGRARLVGAGVTVSRTGGGGGSVHETK